MSGYSKLKAMIAEKYPNYAAVWRNAERDGGGGWIEEFDHHASAVFGTADSTLWEAVDGYAEFCTDALRAQVFFERNGRYKASSYKQVLAECYESEDYMMRRYLPGQFISHYVWPHHQKMLRGYLDRLLPAIGPLNLFYEVGVGCGMYSLKTLESRPSSKGIGFDISKYSLNFTRRVIEAHGFGERYSIQQRDVIARPVTDLCDLVISQEVLEHLEDPPAFLRALRAMLKPGGHGYITAAINAGHTDHIYLYRTADEVSAQLRDAGFDILDNQVESNYPEKPVELRPTAAGFLVLNPA